MRTLRSLMSTDIPEYGQRLDEEHLHLLQELDKVDYTTLRYLDIPAPEFEISFMTLKSLIKYTFDFVKNERWKVYQDEEKLKCLQSVPGILVSMGTYDKPLQSIFVESFHDVVASSQLTDDEKQELHNAYIRDDVAGRYSLVEVDAERLRSLHSIFQKAGFVMPDFGRFRIEILGKASSAKAAATVG